MSLFGPASCARLAPEAGGEAVECRFGHGTGLFSPSARNMGVQREAALAGADWLILRFGNASRSSAGHGFVWGGT